MSCAALSILAASCSSVSDGSGASIGSSRAAGPDAGHSQPAASPHVAGRVLAEVASGNARLVRPLDPTLPIELTIVVPPHREALNDFVRAVTDPLSPSFRKFLSIDEVTQRFAASDAELDAIEAWTKSQGLRSVERFRTHHGIRVTGSVGDVSRALALQINEYELSGHHFFAHDRSPTIPGALAPLVGDILGLESHRRTAPASRNVALADITVPEIRGVLAPTSRPRPKGAPAAPSVPAITGPLGTSLLEPNDLWASQGYNFGALHALVQAHTVATPNGSLPPVYSSIAIPDQNLAYTSDLQTFFADYGLVNQVIYTSTATSSPDAETTLDVEWSVAITNQPGTVNPAAILYTACGTTLDDLYDGWESIESADNARIFSASVGGPESAYGESPFNETLGDFYDNAQTMVAAGYSLVAASGDRGAWDDGGNAQYPASDPYFLAVGGTQLTLDGSGLFTSEVAWGGPANPSVNAGGGGGGCSGYFEPPPWQASYVNTPSASNYCVGGQTNRKSIPDLALNATGQMLIYNGGETAVGGTSIGAPEMAGFLSLENAYLEAIAVANGTCPAGGTAPCAAALLGSPGPAIWAASGAPHNPFYDIISGNNAPTPPGCAYANGDPNQCTNGYVAIDGYDKVTGFGSINALQLAWALNWYAFGKPTQAPSITFNGVSAASLAGGACAHSTSPYTIDVGMSAAGSIGIAGYTYAYGTVPDDVQSMSSGNTAAGTGGSYYTGPQHAGSSLTINGFDGTQALYVRVWDNAGNSTVAECPAVPLDQLSATPTLVHVARGSSSTVDVVATGGWVSSYSPTLSLTGLPSGVTPSINYSTDTIIVTLSASLTAALGSDASVTLTATAGGVSHSLPLSVDVTGCVPQSCSGSGVECGALSDGCGDTLQCGTCSASDVCVAGGCVKCTVEKCTYPEVFSVETCKCAPCPCGTLKEGNGTTICAAGTPPNCVK